MKLREFVNLYAGDEVLMNLYSEDGTEFDTVPIDPSLASTNRIDKKWLDGEVEYFDFHDGEFYVSVSIPTVSAATSRKKSFTVTAARNPKQFEVYVSQEYVPGYGWEDITVYDDASSESLREAKNDVKDYRDNGFNARVVTRRIDNPNYQKPTNEITYDEAVAWVESCPYAVEDLWGYRQKNYIIRNNPKDFYGAQVFIDEGDTVRVRNIATNRTKQVYSVPEMENAINKILKG